MPTGSLNSSEQEARTLSAPDVIGVAARSFERLNPRVLRVASGSAIRDLDWALKFCASSLLICDNLLSGTDPDGEATIGKRTKVAARNQTMPTTARGIGAWRGQLMAATRALIKANDAALAAADGPALRRLEAVVDRWSKLVQFERERRNR